MRKYIKYITLIIVGVLPLVLLASCTTDESGAAGLQPWMVVVAVILAFVMFALFGRKK
jgi:hypothetical protein